jgi:hypothetical protein
MNSGTVMRERNANPPITHRALKVIAFILLAWCLGGPLIEVVDHWDNFRAEIADIACSAGGRLTLILMGTSVAMGLAQLVQRRYSNFLRKRRERVLCLDLGESTTPEIEELVTESPPPLLIPLRI